MAAGARCRAEQGYSSANEAAVVDASSAGATSLGDELKHRKAFSVGGSSGSPGMTQREPWEAMAVGVFLLVSLAEAGPIQ